MKRKQVENIKTALLLALATFFGTQLIIETEKISAAVTDAVLICEKSVIPSLFPFLVFSSFINKTGMSDKIGKLLSPITRILFGLSENCGTVILMSLIGGFPVGPSMTAELLKNGKITEKEAEKLCLFCINAGPAFVISTVGFHMLGSIKAGAILYISTVLSMLTCGIITCNTKILCKDTNSIQRAIPDIRSEKKQGVFETLCAAVNSSAVSMFRICAYILIFSAMTAVICSLPQSVTETYPFTLFKASLEVTAGCKLLCAEKSSALLLPTVAAMLSFCGFCVHAQVHGSIRAGGLTYPRFLISRFFTATTSFLFCRAACLLFPDTSLVYLSTCVPAYADTSTSVIACISMLLMSILLVLDLDIPKDLC